MEKTFTFKHLFKWRQNTHIMNKFCGPSLEDFDRGCTVCAKQWLAKSRRKKEINGCL
jgi:hypothetical protein